MNITANDKPYQFHFSHRATINTDKPTSTKINFTSPNNTTYKYDTNKLHHDFSQTSIRHVINQTGYNQKTNPQKEDLSYSSRRLSYNNDNRISKLQIKSYQKNQDYSAIVADQNIQKKLFEKVSSKFQSLKYYDQQIQSILNKLKSSHNYKKQLNNQLQQIKQTKEIQLKSFVLSQTQAKQIDQILLSLQNIDKKMINQQKINQQMKKEIQILKKQNEQLLKKQIIIQQCSSLPQKLKKSDLFQQNKMISSIGTQQTDSSFQKSLKSINLEHLTHTYQEQYRKVLSLFSIQISQQFHYEKLVQVINKMTLNIQKMSKDIMIYKQRDSQFYQFKKKYKQFQKQSNNIKKSNNILQQEIQKYVQLTDELNKEIVKLQLKALNVKYSKYSLL